MLKGKSFAIEDINTELLCLKLKEIENSTKEDTKIVVSLFAHYKSYEDFLQDKKEAKDIPDDVSAFFNKYENEGFLSSKFSLAKGQRTIITQSAIDQILATIGKVFNHKQLHKLEYIACKSAKLPDGRSYEEFEHEKKPRTKYKGPKISFGFYFTKKAREEGNPIISSFISLNI